jgi:hypothetical protein
MKYICLGYIEPGKLEGMTEDEQHQAWKRRVSGSVNARRLCTMRLTSSRPRLARYQPTSKAPV